MKILMVSYAIGSLAKFNTLKRRLKSSLLEHINAHWSLSIASTCSMFQYSDSDVVKPFYLDFEQCEDFYNTFHMTEIVF